MQKVGDQYQLSIPMVSGAHAYQYVVHFNDRPDLSIDDPANPSPTKNNPNSDYIDNSIMGDYEKSIVYGMWDAEKQSQSPNLDFVRPVDNHGTVEYVEYTGVVSDHQDLAIYLPYGYDADRAEPYKVIYTSHGMGGNETYWFAMGQTNNIMDHIAVEDPSQEAIIVNMDNSTLDWNYEAIGNNVVNYIIPYMNEHYNVSDKKEDRAFCGLSMGGMTTMNMYFDHPTEFGYFGIFSGTDMRAVKETEGLDEPIVMAAVGTCDIASEKILPNDNPEALKKYEDLVRWADENDMSNIHAAGYYEGAHDWFVWSQCFCHFATEYLWK